MNSTTTTAGVEISRDERRFVALDRVTEYFRRHPGLFIFLLALSARVFIASVLTRYFSGSLVLDDTTYHQMAADMASGQRDHWDDFTNTLYWATATFMVPVTLLYKLFGPTAIVAQLMIGLVGSLTAVFVWRLAAEFLEPRWAVVAGVIVALLPSQAFWSSMLMKDAFVWCVLAGLALTIAVASRSTGLKLALLGVLAASLLIALSYLRLHTLVVASWAMIAASFFGIRAARGMRIGIFTACAVLIPLLFGGIGPAGLGLVTNAGSLEDRRFQNAVGARTAVVEPPPAPADAPQVDALKERVAELTAAAERSTSKEEEERLRAEAAVIQERIALLQPIRPAQPEVEGPLDPNVRHLPRGLSVMLLEPFPLPFEGTLSLRLARLEGLVWYPIVFLAAVGLWQARRYLRQLTFPLLAGAGIVVMYALTEGNVGTAQRHRGEFVWAVAVLAAVGFRHLRSTDAA